MGMNEITKAIATTVKAEIARTVANLGLSAVHTAAEIAEINNALADVKIFAGERTVSLRFPTTHLADHLGTAIFDRAEIPAGSLTVTGHTVRYAF